MGKTNPDAENHPCMDCIHGYTYTMWGKLAGNVCKHPVVCGEEGFRLGKHFADVDVPEWCPRKEEK